MKKRIVSLLVMILTFNTVGLSVHGELHSQPFSAKFSADITREKRLLEARHQMLDMINAEAGIYYVKLGQIYTSELQETVVKRSETIDRLFIELIQGGSEGKYSGLEVREALKQTLNWFFFEEIHALIGQVTRTRLMEGEHTAAREALQQGVHLYLKTLAKTADAMDEQYKTQTKATTESVLIPSLMQAADQDQPVSYSMYSSMMHRTLLKVFILSSMNHAEQMQLNAKAGQMVEANAHKAGLSILYKSIAKELGMDVDAKLNEIQVALEQDSQWPQFHSMMKTHLPKVINRKVTSLLNQAFDSDKAKNDQGSVLELTSDAISLAGALEIWLRNEQTEQDAQYVRLQGLAEAVLNSVHHGHIEKGKAAAFDLLAHTSKLSGVYFKVGDRELNLKGTQISMPQAASYIDHASNRTMVSIRLIADVLGAKVTYDASKQQIQIQDHDIHMILHIDSPDVWVNGRIRHKLPQKLALRKGRSYIPLHAIAPLLGCQMFWYNGHIVIN